MTPSVFETAVSAIQRPQTHVLDRAATAFGECAVISVRGFDYHSQYSEGSISPQETVVMK
jgi:hypothetical protein